jgi:hypothetical protein
VEGEEVLDGGVDRDWNELCAGVEGRTGVALIGLREEIVHGPIDGHLRVDKRRRTRKKKRRGNTWW